jgi:cytochrome c oxidase subunit II
VKRALPPIAVPFALALAACSGDVEALEPAGVQAARIHGLWTLFYSVCVAVYVVVLAVVVVGAIRRRMPRDEDPSFVLEPEESDERRSVFRVAGAVGVTATLLLVLLGADFTVGRRLASLEQDDANALHVRVTAQQWWWHVEYLDPVASRGVTTANEIHVPVGRTVHVELESRDVIHSFWVPRLHGKKDMIPGHPTHVWLRADEAGTFVGRCAEFCGYEHAQMRFLVVAEPADRFESWLDGQREPAREPASDSATHGRAVFLAQSCVLCHTIRGTTANGRVGPDLTHLASRSTIAAGSLPFARGHLSGWVVDPQSVKPGTQMPQNPIDPSDLRDLLDWLEGLE